MEKKFIEKWVCKCGFKFENKNQMVNEFGYTKCPSCGDSVDMIEREQVNKEELEIIEEKERELRVLRSEVVSLHDEIKALRNELNRISNKNKGL